VTLFEQVEMSCYATVAGHRLETRKVIPAAAYDDRLVREAVEKTLREELVRAILDKWTPVVKVRR
jgi:hypothetical protein